MRAVFEAKAHLLSDDASSFDAAQHHVASSIVQQRPNIFKNPTTIGVAMPLSAKPNGHPGITAVAMDEIPTSSQYVELHREIVKLKIQLTQKDQ
jgi:hypothetical protein